MDKKTIEKLELNKILAAIALFAVLPQTKRGLVEEEPCTELSQVKKLLDLTSEADDALFHAGVGRIEEFPEISDELERSAKGSTLSCKELLGVSLLLRSARVAYRSIKTLPQAPLLCELADGIYFDESLERDITDKILSEDEVSDYASDDLYKIGRAHV